MRNKKGWLKLVEAGLAIVLLGSVLLVVYINNSVGDVDRSFLLDSEDAILEEIARNETLRLSILSCVEGELNSTTSEVYNFTNDTLEDAYSFKISCCPIVGDCGVMGSFDPTGGIQRDVFVRERIISSNSTHYSPKRVTIYSYVK